MTRTEVALLTLTGVLLVAWLTTGAGRGAPGSAAVDRSTAAAAADDAISQVVQARTGELRMRLNGPPRFQPVRRNPFAFGLTPQASIRRAPAAVVALAETRPPRPELVLSGIAEDAGLSGPVRTAVIAAPGQLILAKEGDRILSRFLIVRIAADAVQVRDGEGGEVFTLALK
ncbi:MAG TPA: hypothetical protein VGK32_01835 [Vicinamibacterales bacterium]|jgi:hypothetical protein